MTLDLTQENIDKADAPTLDAMVAVHVMGWPCCSWKELPKGPCAIRFGDGSIRSYNEASSPFAPSTDPRDFWRVVERMREMGWLFHITVCFNGYIASGREYFVPHGDWSRSHCKNGFVQQEDDFAGVAICRAALRAVLAGKENEHA